MIIDSLNTFLDTGDMSNAVGTANLGNVIDLFGKTSVTRRDISNGEALYVVWTVTTAPVVGAATFALQVVSDAQDPITTNGTETVHLVTPTFTQTELPQGTILAFPLPKGIQFERFLGVQLVTAGATETAMVGDVHLSPFGNVIWTAYKDAQNDDV